MNDIRWNTIALFEGLSEDELALARPLFDKQSVDKGQVVVAEGDKGSEMFVLVSGKVRVVKSMLLSGIDIPALTGQDPRKVLVVLTGETHPMFGEMALIDSDTRSASVETLEPSVFLKTDRERFFGLIEREPKLGCKLLLRIASRMSAVVRSTNHEVVKLTTALALILSGAGQRGA
ncbi:hypothetical protein JCM15519_26440 [Fundidesulfovibrio butyratiphilus]